MNLYSLAVAVVGAIVVLVVYHTVRRATGRVTYPGGKLLSIGPNLILNSGNSAREVSDNNR